MVGYLATQWWAVSTRSRIEKKRSQLELDVIRRRIEILNQKAEAAPEVAWNGYRKFTVAKKALEAEDTYSFYLKPHDGKRLSNFKPGQYLTFQLQAPGGKKPEIRCYSLSDGLIDGDHYRVTIKRATPYECKKRKEPFDPSKIGVISSHFCDGVKEGDILDVKAPSGKFFLDVDVDRPVVLLGGGIGVTPMLTMARVLTHIKDTREIYFFFGCSNGKQHMLKDEMVALQKANPKLRLHICYSKPDPEDDPRSFNHKSRVSPELLKEVLPSNNFQYYLCGPGPFMGTLMNGLLDWGVPLKDLHYEDFGPSTWEIDDKYKESKPAAAKTDQVTCEVTFEKSSKVCSWDPATEENLTKICEENEAAIGWGCYKGSCGECMTAIKSGEVSYPDGPPDYEVEAGCCLPCVCCPKGNLVLDA
ncbi:MAG: FAD-binding oxidoreductase [Luteolibacter sp.]